jgi:hypothetical protein
MMRGTQRVRPVYSRNESQLAEDGIVVVEIIVFALGDALEWDGWHLKFEGRTPVEGAGGAAFRVIRDIMSRFPSELAATLAGTFPRVILVMLFGFSLREVLWLEV